MCVCLCVICVRLCVCVCKFMHSTACYNGGTSVVFPVDERRKAWLRLKPSLFGIFFSMLLLYTFPDYTEVICLCSKTDCKLYSTTFLRARTKIRQLPSYQMLFATTFC